MTRIFYDTEFLENGSTITLISIGMVADDGSRYYAVNSDMPVDKISEHEWLMDNVVPQLPLTDAGVWNFTGSSKRSFTLNTRSSLVKPRWVIANEVRDFLQGFSDLELWAWYGAYDHVALCQLWGTMIGLPKGVPMWTNDLQQLALATGREMPEQPAGSHNALADALFNEVRFRHLTREDLSDVPEAE